MAALEVPGRPSGRPARRLPSAATDNRSRDPLPEPNMPSGLSVDIVDVVRIPPSSNTKPLRRLNLLSHTGDRSGRLFVADMRGEFHVLKSGRVLPTPFLEIAAVRQEYFFIRDSINETGLSSLVFHPEISTPWTTGLWQTLHGTF